MILDRLGTKTEIKVEQPGSFLMKVVKCCFMVEDPLPTSTAEQKHLLKVWSWAIENMKSLHFNSIIFSSEDHDIIRAIIKPSSWPALKFYSSKLTPMFQDFLKWRVLGASRINCS